MKMTKTRIKVGDVLIVTEHSAFRHLYYGQLHVVLKVIGRDEAYVTNIPNSADPDIGWIPDWFEKTNYELSLLERLVYGID